MSSVTRGQILCQKVKRQGQLITDSLCVSTRAQKFQTPGVEHSK